MQRGLDYLHLHFLVFMWGFTGILVAVINLPILDMVVWRTLLSAIGVFGVLIFIRVSPLIKWRDAVTLLGVGILVGLHWICFFAGVKAGGASVGIIGLSTAPLFVALMTPLFCKRSISRLEVVMGLSVVGCIVLIAHVEQTRVVGLLWSILAAFFAALYSSFNGNLVERMHHQIITFYEMLGALMVSFVAMICFNASGAAWIQMPPRIWDWLFLGCFSLLCTVYAYAASIELLKRLSVYAINLAVNLEPIWGMFFAILLLGEHHELSREFYLGASTLCVTVFMHPFLEGRVCA